MDLRINSDQMEMLRASAEKEVIFDELTFGKDAVRLRFLGLVNIGYFSSGIFVNATKKGRSYFGVRAG